jgi:predicted protein tyrosine phosphatase
MIASVFIAFGESSMDKKNASLMDILPVIASVDLNTRQIGYVFADDGKNLVFLFDAGAEHQFSTAKVNIAGSFNGWKPDDRWEMKADRETGLWWLEMPAVEIAVPGNSGQPEFKFIVTFSNGNVLWLDAVSTLPGYRLANNNLILFPGEDPVRIFSNFLTASKVKTPNDFDLSTAEGQSEIANFRLVPGTARLYRSYHPYKISRPLFDTEKIRIRTVDQLMEKHSIRSIVCLSGKEPAAEKSSEAISAYQQDIIARHHELFTDTDYDTVYYHSTGKEFGNLIRQIVEFIINEDNEGPFLVHCRLGTDRTGVVSAVLAALCGAPWKAIRDDYRKSNLLGILEFRDDKILRYSLENMTGRKLADDSVPKKELSDYFIRSGYLTQAEIDKLVLKLN